MSETGDTLITLRGGLQVPLAAIQLGLELEERGIELRLDGDTLVARPGHLVSNDDLARIRHFRADLKRLVRYEAPPL